MTKILYKWIIFTITLLAINGCGGGSTDQVEVGENNNSIFKLEIKESKNSASKITIDSTSSISRVTRNITEDKEYVYYLESNKNDTSFGLSGNNKNKFSLQEISQNKSYDLKFKNPAISGEYQVDIIAKHGNDEIVFKIKVVVSTNSSKAVLVGKKFYFNDTNLIDKHIYKKYLFDFDMDTLTIADVNITNDNDINSTTYNISYGNDMITIDLNNENKECKAKYNNNQYGLRYKVYTISCLDQNRVFRDWIWLRDDKNKMKKYPFRLRGEKLALESRDINNTNGAPQIKVFTIKPNVYIKNNRAYLDSYYRDGKAKIHIELDSNSVDENTTTYLFFNDKDASEVNSTGNHLEINRYSLMNISLLSKGDGKFTYTLSGQNSDVDDSNKFTDFPVDAYLVLYACKDSTLSRNTCSFSSLSVNIQ